MALTKISTGMLKQDAASSDLNIDAGTLYIDVSNNRVGINTTSPNNRLEISGGNIRIINHSTGRITFNNGSTEAFFGFNGAGSSTVDSGALPLQLKTQGSNHIRFDTNSSERMRIDSSGNLLVGTTAATAYNNSSDVYGFNVYANGQIASSVNGAQAAYFNRQNSDGIIADFRKDGTTVGSIGVQGDRIYFAGANEAVGIDDSWNAFVPLGTGGGNSDADTDLGNPSSRFKDLYLSNKVYAAYIGEAGDTDTSINFDTADTIKLVTGGTERMRIDASGNVGIGTTAPSAGLHIENSSGATLFMGDTNGRNLRFRTANSGSQNTNISSYAGLYLGGADNQNHMLIDGTGKVGIGTTSPNNKLEIQHGTIGTGNGSNNTLALRYNSTTLYGQHYMDANGIYHILADASGVAGGNMQLDADTTIRFATGSTPTERMRIDGAGRVLIGTTDTSPWNNTGTDTGIMLSYDGWIAAAASSQSPLELNRMSNDGNIINLRKDGAIRGRIANDSTSLVVTGSSTGLKFGSAAIWPTTGGGVTNSNGAKDLGASTVRFKDLYLSGVAYANNFVGVSDTDTGIDINGTNVMKFNTGGSERMRIDASGELTLGNPSGGSALQLDVSATGSDGVDIKGTYYTGSYGPIKFHTGGSERLRIASGNPYIFLGDTGHSWTTFHAVAQIGRTGAVATYDSGANQQTIVANNTYYGSGGYTSIEGTSAASYMNVNQGHISFFTAPTIAAGSVQTFTQRFQIHRDGNIGIGTAAPASTLDLTNTSDTGERAIRIENSSARLFVGVEGSSGNRFVGSATNNGFIGTTTDDGLELATANAVRAVITNTGNVGIGTTSPSVPLHIKGSGTYIAGIESTSAFAYLGLRDSNSGGSMSDPTVGVGAQTNDLAFRAGGAERMRIDSAGRVGIGTSSPSANLDVIDPVSGNFDGKIHIGGNGSNRRLILEQTDVLTYTIGGTGTSCVTRFVSGGSAGTGTEAMRIDASSNLLLGKSTSNFDAAGIEIRGTGELIVTRANDLLHLNRISSDGTLVTFRRGSSSTVGSISVATTGTTYNTTSDRKLKENIELISDGKEKLMLMKASTFNFIADEEKQKMHGFIAQEMMEVIPEAVTGDGILNMDYGRITPILVAALQDAFKEIEELRNKLENK